MTMEWTILRSCWFPVCYVMPMDNSWEYTEGIINWLKTGQIQSTEENLIIPHRVSSVSNHHRIVYVVGNNNISLVTSHSVSYT